MMFAVLLILIAILYVAEGYHDASIEEVQKTGDIRLIEAWHKRDTIFHVFMNVSMAFGMFVFVPTFIFEEPARWFDAVVFGLMLLGFRQIFMVIPLNKFRNRKTFYIGTTAKFDKIVGKYGWLIFALAALDIVCGILYFYIF